MARITIRQLLKKYASAVAVDKVDLDIEDGELVVLLGPSGCGKTTTLRCVAGLEDVSGGEITIGSTVVSDAGRSMPPEQRGIGMVFQSYALWPHMTVEQNIAFGPRLKKLPTEEIAERVSSAIRMVGLDTFTKRHVSQLSGGQQQRVALARAMALRPKVLLFDEPLSNLDAQLRERMRFEIRQIQQRLGITSIYVTHDQQEAMVMADRVVLMNGGRIEQIATPHTLYHRPVSRFAAEFIGLINFHEALVSGRQARLDGGLLFQADNPDGIEGRVELVFRPERVRIVDDTARINTFEAVVTESYFLGSLTDLLLDVAGCAIRAQVSPPRLFEKGQRLRIHVPPEDILLLPAHSGQRSAERVAP